MGCRLRSLVAAIALALLLPTVDLRAESFASCWVTSEVDSYGVRQQITRCRIAGGTTVDYASDSDVPSVLYPQTGTDITGQCWYYTSGSTPYVILAQYANGDADIGFDTDPSAPGGIVAIGPTLPRCTSEPTPATDPFADAWEYVMQYVHPPPTPELSPQPGDGITGMDTYVGLPVPDVHTATIASGLSSLEVYIEVSAVEVDWGDGLIDSYPPTEQFLAGYPEGFVTHVYETKDAEGVPIGISYDWTARWRLVGGVWEPLAVPNTTTTVVYPLAEIVSDLTK